MRRYLLCAVILSVALSACSDKANKQATASSVGDVSRLADNYVVDRPTPKRHYKVGVLFPFIGIPFWTNEAYGILDQAKKMGVDVVWLSADGYQNVDRQVSQIENLQTQHVDGILLAATSYAGTVPVVEGAVRNGIPVVNHVTSTNSASISSRVMTDYELIGRKQAETMKTLLHGTGQIVMLDGPSGAEWATNEVRGFKDTLSHEAPGIKIVAERFSNPDRTDAQRNIEDLLVTFPELKGVFSVTDSLAMGAVDAILHAGKGGQIQSTTAGFSQDTLAYMHAGYIAVNVDENPVVTGRVAINTLVRVLNGEKVPHTIYVPNPAMTATNMGSDAKSHWAPSDWRLQ